MTVALGNLMQKVGIVVDADSSLAVSALDKTSLAMRRTTAEAKKAGTTSGSLIKLNKAAKSLVSTYAGVAAGAVAVGAAVWTTVKAYAESEAVAIRLERAVNNTGATYAAVADEIDRTVQAQSRMAAFDDEMVAGSLTTLTQATGDYREALALNTLAINVARAKGKDLGQTATVIGKVYNGNVGALKKYGITVREGATATEALAELQKMAAGQAEAYGQSTAGSLDRMSTAWGNLKERAGEFAVKGVHLDKVMNAMAYRVDEFASGQKGLADYLWMTVNPLENITSGVRQYKAANEAAVIPTEALTLGVVDATTAMTRYTGALDEQQSAIAASQDAELGMLRAQDAVTDKRKALTAAIKEHGKKSREARTATLELKIAEREAAAASAEFKTKQAELADSNNRLANEGGPTVDFIIKLRKEMQKGGSAAATLGRRISAIANPGRNTGGFTAFAQGGIVTQPTHALIGEAGAKESVISWDPRYRDRSLAILERTAAAIGARGGGGGVSVVQNITSPNPQVTALEAKRLLMRAFGG